MDYDEKYFKISANKKALRMWVIIGLALTGAYMNVSKVQEQYHIQFCSVLSAGCHLYLPIFL